MKHLWKAKKIALTQLDRHQASLNKANQMVEYKQKRERNDTNEEKSQRYITYNYQFILIVISNRDINSHPGFCHGSKTFTR